MASEPTPIEIDNPGVFVLPDGEFSIDRLRVHRNQEGQTEELVFVFDRKLRSKLRERDTVQVRLKSAPGTIEIDSCGAPCSDQELSKLGLRHLHLTMLPINLIQVIDVLVQSVT